MNGSINKELEILKKIILNQKNKKNIIRIIRKATEVKVSDFEYKDIIYLKRIIEYDFSIIKLVGKNNGEIYNFYIKIVKGGEIKKSVFCCWSLLQEEYKKVFEKHDDTIDVLRVNKVSIKDNSNQNYRKIISLKVEGNISFNFEVNFIELETFLKDYEVGAIEELNNVNISNKDILLIMVKKEKNVKT